jgi:hypothetical protein
MLTMLESDEWRHYHIVLECKVKPDKVRICSGREDYWVVNPDLPDLVNKNRNP